MGVQKMREWQPIETAPKDGSPVWVKRVYKGEVVDEGEAVFALLHPNAPSLRPPSPDLLNRPEVAAFNNDPARIPEREAWRTTPKWLRSDRMYLFPEPTHWSPKKTQSKTHAPSDMLGRGTNELKAGLGVALGGSPAPGPRTPQSADDWTASPDSGSIDLEALAKLTILAALDPEDETMMMLVADAIEDSTSGAPGSYSAAVAAITALRNAISRLEIGE